MKLKSVLSLVTLSLVACAASIQAQTVTTNQVPNQLPAFPSTVAAYFTSQNTNFTWVSNRLEISAGADYLSSINWANYIKLQVDFGRFDLEGNFRNVGIGGQIQSVEGGGGYAVIESYDTKVIGYLDGGYDFDRGCGLVEPGAVIRKKGTLNTYFEAGVSWPFWFNGPKNQYPDIHLGTGFTY